MKYVIELEEAPFTNDFGETLYRAKGFNSRLIFDQNGIDKLEPYKEQDCEKVWEIAKKLALPEKYGGCPDEEIEKIFGLCVTCTDVFRHYTVSEVLDKVNEYEYKLGKELNIGDEVSTELYGQDRTAIVRKIDNIHGYAWVFGKDFSEQCPIDKLVKTGKSYPEVAKAINGLR